MSAHLRHHLCPSCSYNHRFNGKKKSKWSGSVINLVNNNLRIELKGEDTRGNESLFHHVLKEWGSFAFALTRKTQSDFPLISRPRPIWRPPASDFGKRLTLYWDVSDAQSVDREETLILIVSIDAVNIGDGTANVLSAVGHVRRRSCRVVRSASCSVIDETKFIFNIDLICWSYNIK